LWRSQRKLPRFSRKSKTPPSHRFWWSFSRCQQRRVYLERVSAGQGWD